MHRGFHTKRIQSKLIAVLGLYNRDLNMAANGTMPPKVQVEEIGRRNPIAILRCMNV
jgi:hypothetical protein